MGGLNTPRAKKLFTDAITLERQCDGVEIGTHAVQQAKVYNDTQNTALQAQAAQDVIGATLRRDAKTSQFAKGTLINSIAAQYDRNGLSGAPAETATAKALSGVHASVIENMLAADHIDDAVKYHEANEGGMLAADNLRAVAMLSLTRTVE
jgi:hypothetical protein